MSAFRCPACGKPIDDADLWRRCPCCAGSGHLRYQNGWVAAERYPLTRDVFQCEECHGVGFVPVGENAE